MSSAPVFCAGDVELIADFLKSRVGGGNGASVADRILRQGFAPSRLLIDRAAELIRRQDVFTMLDDQIPAQKSIIAAIRRAARAASKTVIVVDGGPGTGKSVIALDALGYALRNNHQTFLVSGSGSVHIRHAPPARIGPGATCPVHRFLLGSWQKFRRYLDSG